MVPAVRPITWRIVALVAHRIIRLIVALVVRLTTVTGADQMARVAKVVALVDLRMLLRRDVAAAILKPA